MEHFLAPCIFKKSILLKDTVSLSNFQIIWQINRCLHEKGEDVHIEGQFYGLSIED